MLGQVPSAVSSISGIKRERYLLRKERCMPNNIRHGPCGCRNPSNGIFRRFFEGVTALDFKDSDEQRADAFLKVR